MVNAQMQHILLFISIVTISRITISPHTLTVTHDTAFNSFMTDYGNCGDGCITEEDGDTTHVYIKSSQTIIHYSIYCDCSKLSNINNIKKDKIK